MIKDEAPVVVDNTTHMPIGISAGFGDNTGEVNFPTATITFGENNMPTVELKNWGGINAMMIERATYEIHRASHQHRANELHKQNVEIQLKLRNPENIEKENENV